MWTRDYMKKCFKYKIKTTGLINWWLENKIRDCFKDYFLSITILIKISNVLFAWEGKQKSTTKSMKFNICRKVNYFAQGNQKTKISLYLLLNTFLRSIEEMFVKCARGKQTEAYFNRFMNKHCLNRILAVKRRFRCRRKDSQSASTQNIFRFQEKRVNRLFLENSKFTQKPKMSIFQWNSRGDIDLIKVNKFLLILAFLILAFFF